jgi:prefoldin subunit 5
VDDLKDKRQDLKQRLAALEQEIQDKEREALAAFLLLLISVNILG